MTENSIPYRDPRELAEIMDDPEAAGGVMTAAERLAWHYDNPPKRHDILGDLVREVWGRPRQ